MKINFINDGGLNHAYFDLDFYKFLEKILPYSE